MASSLKLAQVQRESRHTHQRLRVCQLRAPWPPERLTASRKMMRLQVCVLGAAAAMLALTAGRSRQLVCKHGHVTRARLFAGNAAAGTCCGAGVGSDTCVWCVTT